MSCHLNPCIHGPGPWTDLSSDLVSTISNNIILFVSAFQATMHTFQHLSSEQVSFRTVDPPLGPGFQADLPTFQNWSSKFSLVRSQERACWGTECTEFHSVWFCAWEKSRILLRDANSEPRLFISGNGQFHAATYLIVAAAAKVRRYHVSSRGRLHTAV